MKTSKSVKALILAITIISFVGLISTALALQSTNVSSENESLKTIPSIKLQTVSTSNLEIEKEKMIEKVTLERQEAKKLQEEQEELKRQEEALRAAQIVYDGMTLDELAEKLNRSLNSTIAGQGYSFASYSVEHNVDPYLAVAITLHETGCSWSCSTLLQQCNNVGGMKYGSGTKCNGGDYASFDTLDDGIRVFIENLDNNYFSRGLTTPEAINPSYAESTTWATQINTYMNKIKAA